LLIRSEGVKARSYSFGSAALTSTVHSIALENALVSKMGERVDLEEVSSIIEAQSGTIRVEDTDGDSVQFAFLYRQPTPVQNELRPRIRNR
jgi:hypothetical protein